MKTIALVVSLALHLGALSVLPGNDGDSAQNESVVTPAQSYAKACKCDLEMTADCAEVIRAR